MNSLGSQLRTAREAKGVTPSEAAEATHIKVQIIEDLEQNRFHRTYAPIYAKGFIRLYAEYLGLAPSDLLAAYEDQKTSSDPTPTDLVKQVPASKKIAVGESDDGRPTTMKAPSAPALRSLQAGIATVAQSAAAQFQRLVAACRLLQSRMQRSPADTGEPPSATTVAAHTHDEPDNRIAESHTAPSRSQSWTQPIRNIIHGPYRIHAAAIVVACVLIILLLIGILAARRHARGANTTDAIPERDQTPTVIDFFHNPPPPYDP